MAGHISRMLLLAALAAADRYLSVDLGTEYLKIAESSMQGGPRILLNRETRQVGIPAAVAFQGRRGLSRRIAPSDIERVRFKFGAQAVAAIRRNATQGLRFAPRAFARGPCAFRTSALVHPSAALAALLRDALGGHACAGVAFVIPQFWTNAHRRALEDACRAADVELATIVEDFTAMCLLYGSERAARCRAAPRHVVFVDVGATSAKAYAAMFTIAGGAAHAAQTAIAWSERTGGHFFAARIAETERVSLKKAEKLLLTESVNYDFRAVLAPELAEIARVVSTAVRRAAAARQLDEVQIIGGASKFAFVRETIRENVGGVQVLREFNAQEALALGGVLAALTASEVETERQTYVRRISAWNMTVVCGTTVDYCRDNSVCQETVYDRSEGCDVLRIVGPREQIPEGLTDVLGEFRLVNISKIRFGKSSEAVGHISLVSPDAVLRRVSWCDGATCYPIEIEVNRGPEYLEEHAEIAEWVKRYVDVQREEHERLKNIDKIGDQLKKLTTLVLPEYSETGATFPFPSEAKEQFRQIHNDYNSGQIMSYSAPNVKDAIDYLIAVEAQIRSALR